MTTRSFQAETIKEALQMVQQEMGPDAVVISARDIPLGPAWQVWKKTGVEVISISPDEMEKVCAKPEKDRPTGRIIRPGRNGNGVEFIEEKTSIDWVNDGQTQSEEYTRPVQQNSYISSQQLPVTNDVKDSWKPPYLHREDTQASRQKLNIPSQEVPQPKGQNSAEVQIGLFQGQQTKMSTDEPCPRALRRFLDQLKTQGIEPEYAEHLKMVSQNSCSPALLENEAKVKEFLFKYLTANLPIKKWSSTEVPARILFFVGLSGCGKTNSLAKIAIFYSSLLRKKVIWVCADTIRAGGIAEAISYSDAVGIPLELAYTPAELRAVVDKHPEADLILVDTPGFNPSVEEQEIELGSFISELPDAQALLVTSATAKETDSLSCFNSLKYFNLRGSVITKLDETRSFGSVFNFARKTRLPLTFFASSRKASTGLKIAGADLLVDALFSGRW